MTLHKFSWGVTTASYQNEGAWKESDKGEPIWDRSSHNAGIVVSNTGIVAYNHDHRWSEDVRLMR